MAAGPFGCPNRYALKNEAQSDFAALSESIQGKKGIGAWERPIGLSYTGYSTICQYGPNIAGPIVWITLNAAAESVFVPLAVSEVPPSYEHIILHDY